MSPASPPFPLSLIHRVFGVTAADRALAILVDLPDEVVGDTDHWRARREMAASWVRTLQAHRDELGCDAHLFVYRNAHTNNGDLPTAGAWRCDPCALPADSASCAAWPMTTWDEVFTVHQILIAPTQFSATAPLKVAARTYPFRAATMPGFREDMMPALALDYVEVNRRVEAIAALLDQAEGAEIEMREPQGETQLFIDLRYRPAHASGGLLRTPGTAGNLPSGEAYIVPYEGERPGEPSRTAGVLPVQFGDEVVRYTIEGNRAVRVEGGGSAAEMEAAKLAAEPAYGNIAELGVGVLGAFGVAPIGEVLLDEKLGLHIAFGRSDHFGGQVGPSAFSSPGAVVHIDRVYVPACQPKVSILRADLVMPDGRRVEIPR